MTTEFLSVLCLGLCLGYEDDKENEKLSKPSLHAWPSSVAEAKSNVTLKCRAPSQNVTFTLRKVNDSAFQREQSSAGSEAEFPFMHLKPKDAGRYFCAYKTAVSHQWSESSEHVQLVVTDKHDELEAPSMKTEPVIPNFQNERLLTADPQGVTSAELSTHALSEAAADTTLEPPGSHEYVALKV
uniref:V-set and transmembrane domain containing 1 (Predicted) n=1 Tax=Callithrix jacchus TaxID=9483 RepID=B0VXI0_CALJA|nr:V-set and transmembrane domain containing 1 precursor (predicted) [Callithrix jacchus]